MAAMGRSRDVRWWTAVALVALAGVAASACGDDDDDALAADAAQDVSEAESEAAAAPDDSDLVGSSFASTSAEGWTLVEGTQVVLTFEPDAVSAVAGCN